MALNPAEAAARVDQLIALTERLTERIAAEARAIEANTPQEVAALREENLRLTQTYREQSAQLSADPQALAAAPADRRRRLLQASEAFDAVLARQRRAIQAAQTVTEGLLRAIAAEVAAQRPQGAGYGPGARAAAASGDATAIAINRRA